MLCDVSFAGPGNLQDSSSGSGGFDQFQSIIQSGRSIQFSVNFPVGHVAQTLQSFMIDNDDTALESDEEYLLFITSPMPVNGVTSGNPARIIITDDDSKFIKCHVKSNHSF